jgi:hypothetical protein
VPGPTEPPQTSLQSGIRLEFALTSQGLQEKKPVTCSLERLNGYCHEFRIPPEITDASYG